jgi:FtsP/CotA-like multicopper oxidase with cupredoxin domain
MRDSMIPIEPGQRIKLRLLDAASDYVALHLHGHKVLVTHTDGVEVPAAARERRDVVGLLPGQRLDVEVEATDDGLHSYGPGLWMVHDHRPKAVTNNGIGHGGSMTFLAYPGFLDEEGMPKAPTQEIAHLFSPDRYAGRVAGFADLEPGGLLAERGVGQPGWPSVLRIAVLPVLLAGMVLGIRGARSPAPPRRRS